MRLDTDTFELTADHLALARRLHVAWDNSAYLGAPAVGIKRPYGNSDVVGDVYEIVVDPAGWDYEAHDDRGIAEGDPDLYARLMRLHREMELVVQILFVYAGRATIFPGTYKKLDTYDVRSWRRA